MLYMFMTSLDDPTNVIHRPGGHFLEPLDDERVGDVSNVVFSNGWILKDNGDVLIYYASSDTRMHVAVSNIDKLTDYVMNNPGDAGYSQQCVAQRHKMITKNLKIIEDNYPDLKEFK